MGKNIQLKNMDGVPVYPRTLSENVYMNEEQTLQEYLETVKATSINDFYVNDYDGSDIEKIRAAINACNDAGGGNVIFDGEYEVHEPIVVNMDNLNLISYTGAIIRLATESPDTELFRIYSSSNAAGADVTCHVMQGLKLEATNDRTGIGIVFGDDKDGNNTSRDVKMRDLVITKFNIGVDFRKNAYLISFGDGAISGCNICTQMLGGYSNYGERILFHNTTLCNSIQLVLMSNGEGVMYFQNCSFDYSTKFIEVKAGNVFVNGSHLEFRHLTTEHDWLIYCGNTAGHGSLVIRDSAFVCTNPDAKTYKYLFWCDGGSIWDDARYSIEIDSCRFIHWSSTSGYLCGGNDNGIFTVRNSKMNQIHCNSAFTKPSMSLGNKIEVTSILMDENNNATATVEIVNETLSNGIVCKAAKITKTTWLGSNCMVTLKIPNIFGQYFSRTGVKRVGSGGASVWITATSRYNNFDPSDAAEIKPTSSDNTEYAYIGLTGYYFQTPYSIDDHNISIDLNGADKDEVFYVYAEIYQF